MPKDLRTPSREAPLTESGTKKRRLTKATVNEAMNEPVMDMYKTVVEYEEKESSARDADDDANIFYNTCNEIKALLKEILDEKINPNESSSNKIKEKRINISLKFLTLKKLNRFEKFRTKQSRDALQKGREQVDSDHLQLQNLMYESLHLSKEVQKCLEFKSKDEDMELVSVEEFYEKAPASISKPDITKQNPHELKLACLQWELQQRKELAAQCKQLEAKKELVANEIENKKEQFRSLAPNLKLILDATKPLQESLGINIDYMYKLHETACLLPKALYVLFVQMEAFSKVVKWVKVVNIVGECDKVDISREESCLDDISSADSDSDNEVEAAPHRRKASHQDRRNSYTTAAANKVEQRKQDCLKKHPLSVLVEVELKGGETVILEFQWLVQLEVICVVPTLTTTHKGVSATDLLSTRLLLSSLYPGDMGENSPNASTYYHLHRAGIDSFPVNTSNLGIPYKWAQEIAGIDVMTPTAGARVEICQKNIENILRMVRVRCQDRLTLFKEVLNFEKGNCDYSHKVVILLANFVSMTFEDFEKVPSYKKLKEENIVDRSFLFYKAMLNANSVKIVTSIAIPPSYPKRTSIFLIETLHKGVHNSALTNEGIRDMEREINHELPASHTGELTQGLLTGQMMRLIRCLDVYFQTEYSNDFPTRTTFFNSVQGRTRSHPYKHSTTAGGIYTHR